MLSYLCVIFYLFFVSNALKLELTNGDIEGTDIHHKLQKLHSFKGIPFAQPPIGELRFQKPQKVLNWSGTRNATYYRSSCMANSTSLGNAGNFSEDCLYMNVFTSSKCLLLKNCDVAVLLPGRSFLFGDSIQYNDTQILDKFVQHGIVFVVPSYRVSLLGFIDLGHEYEDAPYNIGIYDLIAGLEWIQREIKTFGGDRKSVTLIGENAGATLIQYLLVSPSLQDRELFSQAVLSGGKPDIKPGFSREVTEKFLATVECERDSNSNHTLSIQQKLQCLRAIPTEDFVSKFSSVSNWWAHLKPQSSESLLPGANYGKLVEKRRSIPLIIFNSVDESTSQYEPYNSIEHICRENLRMFDYTHEETIEACARRYQDTNDTYFPMRDIFHAMSVYECKLNNQKEHGEGRKDKFVQQKNPCYLGVFADQNYNISEIFNVQNWTDSDNSTLNEAIMDKFYSNMIQNFIRGSAPNDDWNPTNSNGENYFYLTFEAVDGNKSRREWPKMFDGEVYDKEIVDFYLIYLSAIEKNASQFHFASNTFGRLFQPFNLMTSNATDYENKEEIHQQDEEEHVERIWEYQKLYGYTSLWTIALLTIILLVFGVVFQARGRRREMMYSDEPLQPIAIEKTSKVLNYQAI